MAVQMSRRIPKVLARLKGNPKCADVSMTGAGLINLMMPSGIRKRTTNPLRMRPAQTPFFDDADCAVAAAWSVDILSPGVFNEIWTRTFQFCTRFRLRVALPARDRPYDEQRLLPGHHGVGQRGVRRFVGQILFAREEAQEWTALLCDVIANGAAQHRI